MSTKLISALALASSLVFSGAAHAGQPFDPATGRPVTIMEDGACAPGQTEGNKTCVCDRSFWGGHYKNCRMALVAVSPPETMTPLKACAIQVARENNLYMSDAYLWCLQNSNMPYGSGGYYGYGGATYTPAYQCSGRPNDPRCGQKPADVAHSPRRW